MAHNPAASVRGPSHIVVKRGKTPVLAPDEARQLLDSIDVTTPIGLRDRALIGLMAFSFARIGAALGMKVEDAYTQNRRLWLRLHEKGGKVHEMPCHHLLEDYLHAYIDGCGLAGDPKGALFRTIGRGTGKLTRNPCSAGERPRHDRPPRRSRRRRDDDRQPHLPRHRHHRLSEERRPARNGGGHGEPRLDTHDTALRPPRRPGEPRRDRAGQDLILAREGRQTTVSTITFSEPCWNDILMDLANNQPGVHGAVPTMRRQLAVPW